MSKKFVILANGLRDQRGHYYESSMSLAEAARRNGSRAVLATHVDCPLSLLPDWLETYAIFCTDHWMSLPPADPPDLAQIRANPYSRPRITSDEVREGRASIRDLIASRFEGMLGNENLAGPRRNPALPGQFARGVFHRYKTACKRGMRLTERLAFYLLPPGIYACVRKLVKWSVPPILRPEVQAGLAAKLAEKRRGPTTPPAPSVIDDGPCGAETAKALHNPTERDVVAKALLRLRAANMAHEVEFSMLFKRDLERFLAVADVGADDHVFLGTAHPRELLAIALVCRQLGAERSPTFHLEFRHPLADPSPYALLHAIFFSLYEELGLLANVRFCTDTEQLADEYSPLTSQPFEVLPIPFRQEFVGRSPDVGGPLLLAFLGEARDEKGFAWLPDLIDDLSADYVKSGKARFLIQANVGDPRYNPQSTAAVDRLRGLPRDTVELVGLDGPLSPAAYYDLVSAAHVLLVPYDRERYRAASSGTLSEAIAAGRPVVVPSDTWMAAQLPWAAGEAFEDYNSFVLAVRRVIDNYPTYAARAAACRGPWLAKHSPDALVRMVASGQCEQKLAA